MGFSYKRPTSKDICAYIERLVDKYKSPGSIRNNISAIRTHMTLRGWRTKALDSIQVSHALRAVEIAMRHVPCQRLPISPKDLTVVVKNLRRRRHGSMMALAVLIMFQAFLRQSNLFPSRVATFDPTRHLTASDISVNDGSICLAIKWSKTQQTLGDNKSVTLHTLPGSPLCPVAAYHRATRGKHSSREGPLIRFDDGNPITTGFMKRESDRALREASLSPKRYSLHSLRRGGASYVYYKGASLSDVTRHGGWRSESVRAYLKPPPAFKDTVHNALDTL